MMTTIDPGVSLADLVVERPSSARTLDSLGLDYCCGGSQTLATACLDAGIDVDEAVVRLVHSAPDDAPDDWASLSPSDLLDHLEHTHHAYLGEVLPHLEVLLTKVTEAHGESHPELHEVKATFLELRLDLQPHLMKEERMLFPMIRQLYESEATPTFHCGTLQNPISVMCLEHDRAGELLRRLRSLTSGYVPPSHGCASFAALYAGLAELEADTHMHIHKENNVLFPAAIAEERRRPPS